MHEYVATNIRLSRSALKALKLRAVEEGKSISELIREAVEEKLSPRVADLQEEEFKSDSFFRVIGLGRSGIKDGSIGHDRYLYGPRAGR